MKNIIRPLKTIVLALVIGLSIGYVMAWSAPTAPPPGANVPAPVNIGNSTQYKTGSMGIKGLFQTDSDTYLAVNGGKVGIGTDNPQRQIQIYGSLPVIGLKTQDQLGWSIYVDPSDGSLNFNRQVNSEWTGSKNKVKITANGKVGIGTTNPQSVLDVSGNIRVSGKIRTAEGLYRGTCRWVILPEYDTTSLPNGSTAECSMNEVMIGIGVFTLQGEPERTEINCCKLN